MPTKVLLVDDEEHIRSVLSDSLEAAGYNVESVSSGEEGLESLAKRPADLMIVDLKMPGISGIEFASQARETTWDGQIVILTGFGDMKSAVEAMRAGAYDYLTKPVDLDRLLQTLRQADERRKLVIENRDLLRRLTEANRIKAEFINGMSHEVRTPLGHITGFAQILEDTLENLTDKHQRYLRNIQDGARRLLDLFENILSFSTLKTGDVHVNPESVNLDETLQNAIEASQPSAADLGVTVRTEGDTSQSVRVDKNICTKALGLLLDNAIKFNKEGGAVELGVSVDESLREEMDVPDSSIASGWLSITVRDTGIGIAADQFEFIFELFTQADASLTRSYEGAGIGLALARSLARLHGGTIHVESRVDQGSTFTLILPVADEPVT
jgi:signal transduction histidine kinase